MPARFVSWNAKAPIVASWLPGANVTLSRLVSRNALAPMKVTPAGISMPPARFVSWNAKAPIVASWLPGANITVSRLVEVNAEPMEVTPAGISMLEMFGKFDKRDPDIPMAVTQVNQFKDGIIMLMPLMSKFGTAKPLTVSEEEKVNPSHTAYRVTSALTVKSSPSACIVPWPVGLVFQPLTRAWPFLCISPTTGSSIVSPTAASIGAGGFVPPFALKITENVCTFHTAYRVTSPATLKL